MGILNLQNNYIYYANHLNLQYKNNLYIGCDDNNLYKINIIVEQKKTNDLYGNIK